jgi:hypothetical protein
MVIIAAEDFYVFKISGDYCGFSLVLQLHGVVYVLRRASSAFPEVRTEWRRHFRKNQTGYLIAAGKNREKNIFVGKPRDFAKKSVGFLYLER